MILLAMLLLTQSAIAGGLLGYFSKTQSTPKPVVDDLA
jgi:hypothetical protein